MIWNKKSHIFKVDGNFGWMHSHAQVPFGYLVDSNTLRIYYATRDKINRCVATFIDVDPSDPSKIKYIHGDICLGLGKIGMFDERGAMISCVVEHQNLLYMYYTGWNIGVDTPYRLSIGIAVSDDGGITFKRYSDGPIMDRSIYDPGYCCTPYVLKIGGIWKMWYLSGVKWEIINNHPEPYYHVKYAESKDGIIWYRRGQVSLDFDEEIDAIGNHTVIFEDNIYKMYYSYRKVTEDYRTNPESAYRLGYALSKDGITFTPRNDLFEINGARETWEKTMNAYPRVYDHNDKRYIFYNGNGFGRSGFGYAISEGN
mgnify:CR=1 FL=1|jgi:predicted GH43/DUF377 family glycosyl hydrolase|tara:strand:+ start:978 stop:1916 length:939 start_codon:yes stop_codon:yes gene_type:complete